MALTERNEQDKIEIVGEWKTIQVRTAEIIERDGVEISRTFQRIAYSIDQDLSDESEEVQAIAAIVWTQQLKDAYAAHIASQQIGQ